MLQLCLQTQVCVQQTALDLITRGFDVHVIADAVSSRTMVDRMFALDVRVTDHAIFCLSLSFPADASIGSIHIY